MILPVLAIFGLCVLVTGTAAYFCYNPYRKEKQKVGEAKDTLREIEKTARREVRKNRKSRVKSEKQQALLEKKETFLTKFRKAEKYPAEDIPTAAEGSEAVEEIPAESKAENE